MLIENKVLVAVDTEDIKNGTFICPDGVEEIGKLAFQLVTKSKFTTLIVSDGVTKIGEKAFEDCPALEEIIIPNHTIGSIRNLTKEKIQDILYGDELLPF